MSLPVTPQAQRLIVVSILNWNTAEMTLACVRTLLQLDVPDDASMEILVIDNGSADADFATLSAQAKDHGITVHREPKNLGFAGGTNVGIELARQRKAEFIWLVNSDALINQAPTLIRLVEMMDAVPTCGAATPKLVLPAEPYKTYFCGAYHDWGRRQSIRTDEPESRRNEMAKTADTWVPGTALFLRMAALELVGPLDQRFFAYYEDDEICARLSAAGWVSRVCFDVAVRHHMPRAETDRPPYYFYLIQRNYLLFWFENTPAAHRKMLFAKLMDQAFFDVNKLRHKGFPQHADAALLGIYDFLGKRYGAPKLDRSVPLGLKLVAKLMGVVQQRALKRMLEPANAANAA
jgi:GT2 family glycosyltransferase